MQIYLGADHGGWELGQELLHRLVAAGHSVTWVGASSVQPEDDYPLIAEEVVAKVASNLTDLGILVCRSGGGMAIAANRFQGIRAVEAWDAPSAVHARTDNNANILCLGADWLTVDQAWEITQTWLNTPFSGEPKHVRRIQQLDMLPPGLRANVSGASESAGGTNGLRA